MAHSSASYDFSRRHIGPDEASRQEMLSFLDFSSLDQLIQEIVPSSIRRTDEMNVGPGMSEHEALERLRVMAKKNTVLTSYIGQGYHNTLVPPVIQRNILENPAWYNGLHSLPARDITGKAGGYVQLPDDDCRPDGHGTGQRLSAR